MIDNTMDCLFCFSEILNVAIVHAVEAGAADEFDLRETENAAVVARKALVQAKKNGEISETDFRKMSAFITRQVRRFKKDFEGDAE